MGGAEIEPPCGILGCNAAAKLHPARPGGKGLFGGMIVARPQLDDVAAREIIGAVEFGKPGGRLFRDKIGGDGLRLAVVQGRTDNLLHHPVMEIDARSEFHLFLYFRNDTLNKRSGMLMQAPRFKFTTFSPLP